MRHAAALGIALAPLLGLGLAMPAWAGWEEGKKAFDEGQFTKAYQEWSPAAEKGDADAQFGLAQLYARGVGVPEKDEELANEWFQKAADNGHPVAAYEIGRAHLYGEGKEEDGDKAYRYMKMAAEAGHDEARYLLAGMVSSGIGVEADRARALEMYKELALEGHPEANVYIGVSYFNGEPGIYERDEKEARKWFERAAELGDVNGMVFAARSYANTRRLHRDYVKAYYWYTKAAQQGDQEAYEDLEDLVPRMRQEEVDKAEEMLAKDAGTYEAPLEAEPAPGAQSETQPKATPPEADEPEAE